MNDLKRAAVSLDDASSQSLVKSIAKYQGEQDQQGETNRLIVPGVAEAVHQHAAPNQASADKGKSKKGPNPESNPRRLKSSRVNGRLLRVLVHRQRGLASWAEQLMQGVSFAVQPAPGRRGLRP